MIRFMMIVWLLILGVTLTSSVQMFLQYSQELDNAALFKYLHGITNEFFVDIGGYDPTYASITLPFTDWHGLNIEASENRCKNFLYTRPYYQTLNFAMSNVTGDKLILYELGDDSSSTVSKGARENGSYSSKQRTVKQEIVNSLSLSDLCHKYYLKKPKLMSIDIEGFGYAPLSSNDWGNDKCIPQVIISEFTDYNVASGLPDIAVLLQNNGYIRLNTVGMNTIFIHKNQVQFYKNRHPQGEQLMKSKKITPWVPAYQRLFNQIVPGSANFNRLHLDMRTSKIFVAYARDNLISIPDLFEESAFSHGSTHRPILIFDFNSFTQSIYLPFEYQMTASGEFMAIISATIDGKTQKIYLHDKGAPKVKINIIGKEKCNLIFGEQSEEVAPSPGKPEQKTGQTEQQKTITPAQPVIQPVEPVVQPVQPVITPAKPPAQPVPPVIQPVTPPVRQPVAPAVVQPVVTPVQPVTPVPPVKPAQEIKQKKQQLQQKQMQQNEFDSMGIVIVLIFVLLVLLVVLMVMGMRLFKQSSSTYNKKFKLAQYEAKAKLQSIANLEVLEEDEEKVKEEEKSYVSEEDQH